MSNIGCSMNEVMITEWKRYLLGLLDSKLLSVMTSEKPEMG